MTDRDEPQWVWPAPPRNEADFEAMMLSLDDHLAGLDMKPHNRSMHAMSIASRTLGISGPMGSSGPPFSPADIFRRIEAWYLDHFADRAKVDMSPGSVIVELQRTTWEIKLPRVFGEVLLFISPDLGNVGNESSTRAHHPAASCNVLRLVQGITQPFADRLTIAELKHVMDVVRLGFDATSNLESLAGHKLFSEARADFRHSVTALLSGIELSKAKWESAQCAEKVFKGLLAGPGHEYPRGGPTAHDIEHLGGLVLEKLHIAVSREDLTRLQCLPAVRYGERRVSKAEAMMSHYALLRVLASLEAESMIFDQAGA